MRMSRCSVFNVVPCSLKEVEHVLALTKVAMGIKPNIFVMYFPWWVVLGQPGIEKVYEWGFTGKTFSMLYTSIVIHNETVAYLTRLPFQTWDTIRIHWTLLNHKTKVDREALVGESSILSGINGVAQGLVKLVGGTNRAMIKCVNIWKTQEATDKAVEIGGILKAEEIKLLVSEETKMITSESSYMHLKAWSVGSILLDVSAVGIQRVSGALMYS